ncbi:MAG: 1-deoxy-D-xylulose-5-phosphate synthase, partial [Gammaproteobacteria bacterium]|nr:1-deoxy-D-xylulose-5-phosphate synthase [Gammaproteobacteria bacterium]
DENETRQMLYTGYMHEGPAAVRYPRGTGPGTPIQEQMQALPIGRGRMIRKGQDIAILNFGTRLAAAQQAAEHVNASVADMRFVKPLDTQLINELASQHRLLVTLEENAIAGGAGSGVGEYLAEQGMSVHLLHLGLPDRFVEHGKHAELLEECGLDAEGIRQRIIERLVQLDEAQAPATSTQAPRTAPQSAGR